LASGSFTLCAATRASAASFRQVSAFPMQVPFRPHRTENPLRALVVPRGRTISRFAHFGWLGELGQDRHYVRRQRFVQHVAKPYVYALSHAQQVGKAPVGTVHDDDHAVCARNVPPTV
jgi:hypothetical protein